MGLGHHLPQRLRRLACIHKIINDQPALTVARRRRLFQDIETALLASVIGGDAGRFDQPDLKLACHDGRRHQTATGNRNDPLERPHFEQPPGQRLRGPVKFFPGHRKGLVIGICHRSTPLLPKRDCARM